MKKLIYIIVVLLFITTISALFSSCTSGRVGCSATRGMTGYR